MGDLYRHEQRSGRDAVLELDPETEGDSPVDPKLYGKFAEHLAWNVYHGMSAQLVYNPTFGRWRFKSSNPTSDGGFVGSTNSDRREAMIAEHADQQDYPGVERLATAAEDGLSFWWLRRGDHESVTVSPDVGQHGERGQRVEVREATPDDPRGIMQWLYLPLQRTRTYEYTLTVRARADTSTDLTLALHSLDENGDPTAELDAADHAVGDEWTTFEGTLTVPETEAPAPEELVGLSVTATEPCDVVFDRSVLYPDDHVDGADPDVVDFFREASLPLLRWPGGNFASDYDWRDGVGPVAERPTTNNPAWGGVEPNLFGTVEFIEFCENIGCEPLICVNAGTGTPEEAAAWVEYCNGDPEKTEFGRLRAEHGYPEPFDVQYWEIGNELYGRWQPHWTTPDGNVDRYKRFKRAIHDADPDVDVLACGAHGEWNDRLVAEAADELRSVTGHELVGPTVDDDVDRDTFYHALMGFTDELGKAYAGLAEQMRAADIEDPHYAVTELQLTVSRMDEPDHTLSPPWRGSRHHEREADLPGKKSIAESVWDASIIHDAVRSEGETELITHTGAVNHGGGLQKQKECVWADPCHYSHAMGAALFGKTPIGVDVACDTISVDASYDEFDVDVEYPILDAVAGVDGDDLALVVVHRGSGVGDVETRLDLGGAVAADSARVTTLAADSMAAENTLEDPERVIPETTTACVDDDTLQLTVPEYGLVQVTVSQ